MTSTARPSVAPPPDWTFPVPARQVLGNGLTLLTYDLPGQYVLAVRLGVPLTLRAEPRDKEGVASILAATLDEGTVRHGAEELARLLERKGISFGAACSEAGLFADLDVVKGNLEPALDLMRQMLTEPAFREAEVSRQVRTRLAEIDQQQAVPAYRARLAGAKAFYDPSERSSRPAGGSADTVSSITRDDVADFHRRHVGADGATVAVAGDLRDLDVPALVEASLGGWISGDGPPPAALTAPALLSEQRAGIVLVDRPGSVQSELFVAGPGPDRSVDGGWAPYPVIAFVLGGSPTSRIDAVLREEKGYTYGLRSAFVPRRHGGQFVASGSVRADATAESLRLLLDILVSPAQGFSDKEIRSGVDFLRKTAPDRYATADAVADEAVGMALDGRSTRFTTDNLRDLATVDRDRAEAAYRRFAEQAGVARSPGSPGEGWTIVVVGDAAQHLPAIEALDVAPVTVVTQG